jgi:hypothetical protein
MTEINSWPLKWSDAHTGSLETIQNNSSSVQLVNREKNGDFRPGTQLWLVFMTLSLVALMVSLDGSSISVALPVSALVNVLAKAQENSKLIEFRSLRRS